MAEGIAGLVETGAIVHPQDGSGSSVELFHAMARLSGVPGITETASVSRFTDMIGHHDHYLVVLVDGMGSNLRDLFPAGGFLDTAYRETITSTFPSTTAVALTSLATGLWPAEHGITGWWTHFPEHRRVIAPLLFAERETGTPCEELGLSIRDLIPGEPLVGSFFRSVSSYLPRKIAGGAYDAWFRAGTREVLYRSLSQARRLINRDHSRAPGPSYQYFYVTAVDSLSHRHGIDSEQVLREIRRIDGVLSRLRDRLPGTVRMVVTADHGLVNVPPEYLFTIRPGDTLDRHLIGGQSGEGRAPVFHVAPGHESEFLRAFESTPASEHFVLYTPSELARAGFYGPPTLDTMWESRTHPHGSSTCPTARPPCPTSGSTGGSCRTRCAYRCASHDVNGAARAGRQP
jgi:hypothetical protein